MPNSPHAFGIFGHNYRLTDAMAALGTSQLSRLDKSLEVRRSLMQAYTSRLQGLVGLPAIDDERHAGQSFVVVLPAHVNRADLMAKLLTRGIETGTGTIAIPFAAPYRLKYGFADDDFPRLAEIHESVLALPLHTNLSLDELEYISSTLVELLAR
jgi:dTDP-4-amino-4,6-dideoxygalactose transaminase